MTSRSASAFFLTMKIRWLTFLSFFMISAVVPFLAFGNNAEAEQGRDDYIIQPGDLLQVQIFQEDDLTRTVRVTQGNSITLPLIGAVDVAGLTPRRAQDLIRSLYDRDYLVNPQVNVGVTEYAPRTLNVMGAVNKPGVVQFPQEEELTLVDAIARAGSFNRFADRRKVKLSRTNDDGRTVTEVIDVDELMDNGTNDSWPLQRDDVIFVPERIF
jgi:polysaccharide biosynthesis/export protein